MVTFGILSSNSIPELVQGTYTPQVHAPVGRTDARKSPVGREFELEFFGGDCVIAAVRPAE